MGTDFGFRWNLVDFYKGIPLYYLRGKLNDRTNGIQ
jgi:hypothetical protein